jgi:inosine-uridine nucleoside N-ribohydrolase
MPYEKTGQYAAGTTFAEGLVAFRGRWLLYYGCADSLVAVATAPGALGAEQKTAEPQLAILDTDIGDDIDDAFALGLALRSPELKLLGITTAYGDTELRARLIDRFLSAQGKTLLVAAGEPTAAANVFTQRAYAERGLKQRHIDGVTYLLNEIRGHPGQITLIAIGPLVNVREAIEKDAATFAKLKRVVLMGGSIARGYDGQGGERRTPDAEWNVSRDPAGLRALLASGVPVFMMPLDSTQIHLQAAAREAIFAHGSPLTDQLTLLYHQWTANAEGHSDAPTLFDPVAVAYAVQPDLCPMTPMRLEVDDKGYTRPVAGEPNAQVCLKSDEGGFLKMFQTRILEEPAH